MRFTTVRSVLFWRIIVACLLPVGLTVAFLGCTIERSISQDNVNRERASLQAAADDVAESAGDLLTRDRGRDPVEAGSTQRIDATNVA